MKYYLITFTDYTETIGKQENKTKMIQDARRYCIAWNLDITVKDVQEITENEYNKRVRG